ncbi:MFS transporter [Pseudoxanthomonas winnipegensis]|uniref:MFS transporter n=1 Tax=Pseudoxanthomonas winnipegensis TaxID=2480810 RepID=A0A4Q8LAK3_9GAMM|nr:MFS transporter [Pseudoxanthomonas winnipegensis]RZZ82333.1 MFS transporter [Pseudoxanthomonas winnipegensis]TAA25258.1 MFS transporter [Pseudoxanthomonas winnipegensis]TAA39516.1 MFS transporter [Pseudoxanthomonas winnipegensis]TBV74278.1 MFS transporter [Pseudoxanthomonas winnipegensis]
MSAALASSARAQQHATRAAFFIPGFAMAVWAVLVPFAKARTGVDDGVLGLILLCLGAGSLIAMPVSGALAARLGCRGVMIATTAFICASLPLLAITSNPWLLGGALFVFGAGVGAMDCTMNMQALVVEREARRAMMSGFHAFFSIGGFIGAAAMTALLSAQIGPAAAAVAGVAAAAAIAALSLKHWRTEALHQEGPLLAWPKGIVLFVGILAFVVFMAEGAMLDWSAVFLADVRQVEPAMAGLGYVAFALTMTVARLFGDSVVERLGRIRAIAVGAVLAALGFIVLTWVTPWQASLVGHVLLGLGCANIAPALFSLSGNQKRMPESIAITAVTTLGYAGVLAGPALIGFTAHGIGLAGAFMGVAALLVGVALSTHWLKV